MELTEEYYKVAEVAAIIRTSNMTVYRMLHDGSLRKQRFGGSFRIPRPEVQRILDGADIESPSQ